MLYQKVRLADVVAIGSPGALPVEIDGLNAADLANLYWVSETLGLAGFGFWPVTVSVPTFNPVTHKLGEVGPVTLDPEMASGSADYLLVELPPAPTTPFRVTKADFRRLLTQPEQMLVEIRSKQIDAMTPEAFAADLGAVAFRVMTKAFDEPLEFIELDHPDTIYSVTNVMAPELPLAPGRAERILSGQPPL